MRNRRRSARPGRSHRALISTGLLVLAASLFLPDITETAVANGDTRTLILYHQSTKETLVATFRNGGSYDPAVLEKLNWFLRDWRRDEPTHMDPRLFDVVWEVYHAAGMVDQQITVYSGYRSPETNAMLRRRSRQVAERSQHMLGKAMDSTMPGVSMEKLREIGMRMQRGGVGYYNSANFVHLDVGSVRSWPRMNYDQLARLFPDGKTVHIPSNGQPMARYEEARAEIEARNDGAYAPAQSKGLFAWLFGPKDDEGDEEENAAAAAPRRSNRGQAAVAARQPAPVPVAPQLPAPAPEAQVAEVDPDVAAGGAALVAGQKMAASAQPTLADEDPTAVAAIPMPPRRPVGLMAGADVPLPPARPLTSFVAMGGPRPDAIGKLIAATAAPAKPAALPGVITSGTSERHAAAGVAGTPAVLAYGPDVTKGSPVPTGSAAGDIGFRSAADAGMVPARLDRSNFRTLTAAASTAMTKTHAVLGPAVTGLRQAIHSVGDAFAAAPVAGYVSRFEARTSAPDASRFSGSATQKLPDDRIVATAAALRE